MMELSMDPDSETQTSLKSLTLLTYSNSSDDFRVHFDEVAYPGVAILEFQKMQSSKR